MLLIVTTMKEYRWYVGQDARITPTDDGITLMEDGICLVQADGDELEYIRNNFINIPFSKTKRVQRWFGQEANFIALNL